MTLLLAAVGMLGLVVGSFLNVVIWRVPRGESVVAPASHCPACGAPVRRRDNVPVASWLLLRGRCRDCAAPISARYPVVEAVTALLFVLVAVRVGPTRDLPAFLYLAAVGVALALIDLDVKRLPNAIVLPSYPVAGALLLVSAAAGREPGLVVRALAGMVLLFGFYLVLALVHPAGMGFGDVKLAGLLGLYLGYLGWDALVVGAFLAFLLGGVVGAGLMVAGRATRRSAIPFGPFMLAGALLALGFAEPLVDLYLGATF